MAKKIDVTKQHTALVPKGVAESKLKVSPHQMNIISILLAEIGKKTDVDENLTYTISAEEFGKIQDIPNIHTARQTLRDYICNKKDNSIRHIGFEMWIDGEDFEHYNWFTSVIYKDGIAIFNLSPEIKEYLVSFKKSDQYKIYAKLKYLLPMKSQYSKRIYLMCREYISSGSRFCDTDWNLFREKLQIPKSYSTSTIIKQVLDPAVEEVNNLSDITIDYQLNEEVHQGGSRPVGIQFTIKKKQLDEEDTEPVKEEKKTVVDIAEDLTKNLSKEEILQLQQKLGMMLEK